MWGSHDMSSISVSEFSEALNSSAQFWLSKFLQNGAFQASLLRHSVYMATMELPSKGASARVNKHISPPHLGLQHPLPSLELRHSFGHIHLRGIFSFHLPDQLALGRESRTSDYILDHWIKLCSASIHSPSIFSPNPPASA